MFVCDNPKIVFVAIPKTATRSIYGLLKDNFGGRVISDHARKIPPAYNNYFSFCIVRNPYDRICSDYWSRCRRGSDRYGILTKFKQQGLENTLESYLDVYPRESRSTWFAQHNFIEGNNINKILHFEKLQEEFNELPFVKNNITLPLINTTSKKVFSPKTKDFLTPRPTWQELVTPAAGKKINNIFKKDFELLDYEMMEF